MKISTKLMGLSVGTVVVVAGLAISLVAELKSVTTGYNKLLEGPVREAQTAQAIQVDFKKQVQEWKDILLRGHNADDLGKYTSNFHLQEAKVNAEAQTLASTTGDPVVKQLLDDFLAADDKLSAKYQAAYDVYVKEKFDFKAADRIVRGQDRAPTDLFDQVVTRLNAQVAAQVAAQEAAAARHRDTTLFFSCALLGLICLAGFIVVRGVLARLGRLKTVSDRLSTADIQGLSIDISGDDEVGEFGQSLQRVAAAIRELLGAASEQHASH